MNTLFDPNPPSLPFDPMPPAQRHSATSIAAAQAIRPHAASLRARVLAWFLEQGERGGTDEECQIALGMNQSQRPRRIELVQAGEVIDSGQTRLTTSGRKATVWIVNK